MTQAIHTILVVLGLPRAVAALIIRLTAILDAMMAAKTTFPSPPLAFALVQAHVAALSSAEAATKTRAAGTRQARDAARKLVIEDAKQLHGYVQQLANASPAQAESIATAAAMTLRKHAARITHDITIKQTVSGTVHVVAKSVKGARAHEWQYSVDAGKSWVAALPTAQPRTSLTGFQPGALVQVRHRSIVKTGAGDWSAAFQAVVS